MVILCNNYFIGSASCRLLVFSFFDFSFLSLSSFTLFHSIFRCKIKVFGTDIPHSVRAAEISAEGKSIFAHDPKGKVADAYRELTKEVLKIEKLRQKHKSDIGR